MCIHVSMYVYVHMSVNICRGQKRASDPPGLKFQVFRSHLMWTLALSSGLWKNVMLLTAEPLPQPHLFIFETIFPI